MLATHIIFKLRNMLQNKECLMSESDLLWIKSVKRAVAGSFASVVAVAVGNPIDIIKVKENSDTA